MSMTAIFVQVEDAEIAGFQADPDSVEALFAIQQPAAAVPRVRVRAAALRDMEAALSRLPARPAAAVATRQRVCRIVTVVRQALDPLPGRSAGRHEALSLQEAWHGVHYLLAGTAEPWRELRTQAVLGGAEIGGDPEGFSGYGPARYFRAAEVRRLSQELCRPEVQLETAARFDSAKMSQLQIYPGWRPGDQDKEWVMDAFRRLRDFYAGAAANDRAIVTCLI